MSCANEDASGHDTPGSTRAVVGSEIRRANLAHAAPHQSKAEKVGNDSIAAAAEEEEISSRRSSPARRPKSVNLVQANRGHFRVNS